MKAPEMSMPLTEVGYYLCRKRQNGTKEGPSCVFLRLEHHAGSRKSPFLGNRSSHLRNNLTAGNPRSGTVSLTGNVNDGSRPDPTFIMKSPAPMGAGLFNGGFLPPPKGKTWFVREK